MSGACASSRLILLQKNALMGRISKTVGFAACRVLGRMAPACQSVPVLGFHSVEDSGTYLSTAIINFRAAMERLSERGIRGITVAEASDLMRSGGGQRTLWC